MPLLLISFISTTLLIGMVRQFPVTTGVFILAIAVVILIITNIRGRLSPQHKVLLMLFISLFIYNLFISGFVGRSAVLAFYPLVAVFLFIALNQLTVNFKLHGNDIEGINHHHDPLWIAKLVFLGAAIIHSVCLILLYLFEPVRVTGLMEDYSQASLIILFAFGMSYPKLKSSDFFLSSTLILFIGYFTTFSRTANLLLALFLLALFIYEIKSHNTKQAIKTLSIILCALFLVYLYPYLIDSQSVNRGGLTHFSTLNSRTIYWRAAWEAILQKPLIGYGLGNFEWTGIKEARPFRVIHFVHNDYLQIWHDLGLFGLIIFIYFYYKFIFKSIPIKFKLKPTYSFIINASQEHFFSWCLLICLSLYMLVNFAISSLVFQVGIALLSLDLIKNEQ